MVDTGFLKVQMFNISALGFSFTQTETLFRLAIIFISIVYTIVKLIKEIKGKNE